MEYKCERCNPVHDFKTAKKLSRHENTPSHKRKIDAEFAAAEEVEKAAAKKIRNEKQIAIKAGAKETERKAGEKETARKAGATASQKRKIDPEFAAAEEVEKAAAKKIRNEKQIAIKAGVKETARLAARNQGKANADIIITLNNLNATLFPLQKHSERHHHKNEEIFQRFDWKSK